MKAAITCPHCIRSYRIDPEQDGKLARCGFCGCHFGVNIARPVIPGEAITLDDPFEVHYAFLLEAASVMARNAGSMFRLAGEPFTPETLVRFVKTLPGKPADVMDFRGGYADKVIQEAHRRCSYPDAALWIRLLDYFIGRVPSMEAGARLQLIAAFEGALSVEFDRPAGTEIALYRKPGTLERWAARRGW